MEIVRLDKSLPVVLIDTSYYIFYRYFSTLKWYQFRNKEIDYEQIHENEEFMEGLHKHTKAELDKICKKWGTKLSQLVFCCDCSREDIWRNAYTERYKQTRVPNKTFNSNIFFKFYQNLEANQEEWGIHKVLLDRLEADDMAYLTKKALVEGGWEHDIYIITNDNDYLQLLDGQTKIFNLTGAWNDLAKRSCGDPRIDLQMKLIMGDKSDNIVAIHSGIGPKTAMKLASLDAQELDRYLEEKGCRETYLKNKMVVDFTMIPEEYVTAYRNKYQICIE